MADHSGNVTYLARCIAYHLADYATMTVTQIHYEETGTVVVFCSQGALAKKVGCGPKEACRAIKQLIDARHLKHVNVGIAPKGVSGRPSNEYRLRFRKVESD